jgi:hypothetical protein
MRCLAPAVRNRAGIGKEDEILARDEGGRQTALGDLDGEIRCKGRIGHPSESLELNDMVLPEPVRPIRAHVCHLLAHAWPHLELDRIPLTIGEADRLDADEPLKGPGKADGRILPTGKEDECRLEGQRHYRGPGRWE